MNDFYMFCLQNINYANSLNIIRFITQYFSFLILLEAFTNKKKNNQQKRRKKTLEANRTTVHH